jgi:hypothetical protein
LARGTFKINDAAGKSAGSIYGRIQFNPGITLRFFCALEEKTFGEFFEDRGSRASERGCIEIPLAISDRHAVRGAICRVERSLRTY